MSNERVLYLEGLICLEDVDWVFEEARDVTGAWRSNFRAVQKKHPLKSSEHSSVQEPSQT